MFYTIGGGKQDCSNGCSGRPRQRRVRLSVGFVVCLGRVLAREEIVEMIYVADFEKMADPGREGEGSGKRE